MRPRRKGALDMIVFVIFLSFWLGFFTGALMRTAGDE